MDKRSAAMAADEIQGWAIRQAAAATNAGQDAAAAVWLDLGEAADDLANMIRRLDRHLPADA